PDLLHVAGEDHQVNLVPAQHVGDCPVALIRVRQIGGPDMVGGNAGGGGPVQGARGAVVADDDHGLGRQPAVPAGVDDRLHVGAAMGSEKTQFPASHGSEPVVTV